MLDRDRFAGMAAIGAVGTMLTAGDPETRELDDGWTVVTADGSRAVHWEHSIAITDDADCAHAKDPEAMKKIARDALRGVR